MPAVTLSMLTLEIRGFASWQEYSFSVPVLFAAWLVGQLLHLWDGRSSALRRHMDDISATEQARAASAVADERARIARELHDVVAHSISVMVVQAAGRTQAAVRVTYLPGRLELDIANQPGTVVPGRASGGHGIVGMRERAALFDGSLKAGPRPGGGYQVLATIPLPAPEKP